MGECVYHSQLSCLTPVKRGFIRHSASAQAHGAVRASGNCYLRKTGAQPLTWRREGVKQKRTGRRDTDTGRSCKMFKIVQQESWINHQKRAQSSIISISTLIKASISINLTIIWCFIVVPWKLPAQLDGTPTIWVKYWKSKHTVYKLS